MANATESRICKNCNKEFRVELGDFRPKADPPRAGAFSYS
jgi:hypothetical protein